MGPSGGVGADWFSEAPEGRTRDDQRDPQGERCCLKFQNELSMCHSCLITE